jgi:hypothetical protein
MGRPFRWAGRRGRRLSGRRGLAKGRLSLATLSTPIRRHPDAWPRVGGDSSGGGLHCSRCAEASDRARVPVSSRVDNDVRRRKLHPLVARPPPYAHAGHIAHQGANLGARQQRFVIDRLRFGSGAGGCVVFLGVQFNLRANQWPIVRRGDGWQNVMTEASVSQDNHDLWLS